MYKIRSNVLFELIFILRNANTGTTSSPQRHTADKKHGLISINYERFSPNSLG
jgi:hypothetical protein